MSDSTKPPEKPKSRFVLKLVFLWLGFMGSGASAVWAIIQEILEIIRQGKVGTLPYWLFAYLCLIAVAVIMYRDVAAERDELAKRLDDKEKASSPETTREENLQKLRTFLDHLRNCEKWCSYGSKEHLALAIERIGPVDDDIKKFLGSDFPAKLDQYIGMTVSVPRDEGFVFGFCNMRLTALTLILGQLEQQGRNPT